MRRPLLALFVLMPVLGAGQCQYGIADATFTITNDSNETVQLWVRPDLIGPENTYAAGETRTVVHHIYDLTDQRFGAGMGREGVPLVTTICETTFTETVEAVRFELVWDGATLTCTGEADDPGLTNTPVDTTDSDAADSDL